MPNGTQGRICKSRRKISSSEEKALSVRLSLTLLLDHGKDWSSLPELVELIGPENSLKLMMIFGGLTLKVPSFDRLVQALHESSAAMAVLKGNPIRDVSKSHNLSHDRVKRVYEALLENRRIRRKILKKAMEQDDKDYIHGIFNDIV
jgi:hypothetical protein